MQKIQEKVEALTEYYAKYANRFLKFENLDVFVKTKTKKVSFV